MRKIYIIKKHSFFISFFVSLPAFFQQEVTYVLLSSWEKVLLILRFWVKPKVGQFVGHNLPIPSHPSIHSLSILHLSSEEATPHVCVGHRRHSRVVNLLERCNLWLHGLALEADKRALVAHLVTVVRRTENSYHAPALLVFEAFRLHLVWTYKHFQAVVIEELGGGVWSKLDANAAFRNTATIHVLWVAPKHLAHDALIRGLSASIGILNLLQGHTVLTEEATVADHNLLVNAVAQRQHAE